MATGDLQGKYQKLAQEYSKLRAQNQVLKRAVVDEQANGTALKEQLKMKDQSLRKQQQEMDSLTFRNQQLAKRVELLQDELSLMDVKGKKTKKNMDTSQLSQEQKSVFDEDLQKKIEENERLHIQFFEASETHRQMESELTSRLQELETNTAQHQAVVDGLTQKYMDTIEKLQGDKAKLEVKCQALEREAKDCRLRTEDCQNQLKTLHTDLSSRLDDSLVIINEKLPFNDTRTSQLNALNVPVHNKRYQLKARELANQGLSFVRDLVTALLNFHTYTEQRVQIFPIDSAIDVVSPLNKKFSEYLHENASYVRPLEDGMLQLFESITEDTVTVLETAVKLKIFSENFSSYVCFLQKILPYQLKSLEEESEFSSGTSALRSRNQELHKDMQKITAVFDKLKTYITLLALPSTKPEGLLRTNYGTILTQISEALHRLHDISQELSKHYNNKAALEQELPAATDKLKTTNDCVLSSLAALTNVTSKIATFFGNNLDYFISSLSYGPKGGRGFTNPLSAETMLVYKKKAAQYMNNLRKPCPASVPYEEALVNRRVLLSSTESREGLAQQVQQSLEKIGKLEQEKEHWMLEAQLSKIKLEKETLRIAALIKGTEKGQLPEVPHDNALLLDAGEHGKGNSTETKSTSLIGMLTVTIEDLQAPDHDSREELIKNHYMTRIAELTTHLQQADSKAVHLYAECRALAKRLTLSDKSNRSLTEETKYSVQSISKLQDELITTKRSYEDQLSMMSDHLCVMNETLSKQREEIDTLKMANKGNSKKNKMR
ncbi:protein phosphatase 1 regulatory subunit 21 [Xenopus laevis]|uniref:Protein phosphatase 1 regulatory subunit 21 n=1 Tax=Xenopus laevis TaxID=8355 RepID=PPR21_XENLA|nr:protein phosphatase 1 regulatory subunit 21 [Xenopus laevis]Q6IR70.1 RecName: Full=Protein phosphatase 1 regulatory subunit 21; AltName: Full=Coiled-coil domain-containing protein 128; AltName: Full=KLRAQ motif-containing protein 1 [Xenopus laevis]AAH71030.1 MGC82266 protein [Xenopus laevis]